MNYGTVFSSELQKCAVVIDAAMTGTAGALANAALRGMNPDLARDNRDFVAGPVAAGALSAGLGALGHGEDPRIQWMLPALMAGTAVGQAGGLMSGSNDGLLGAGIGLGGTAGALAGSFLGTKLDPIKYKRLPMIAGAILGAGLGGLAGWGSSPE